MKEATKANEGASHHGAGWREALEMRLSRRSFLTGAAATAAFSIIGLPRKGAAAETPLQILTGPLTPMGSTAYDRVHLARAAAFVGATDADIEYYDGALVYYLLYYRTGNAQWATRADFLAKGMADYQMDPANASAQRDPSVSPPRSTMAARDYAPLGMAIHYLRTGYANSLAAVKCQAAGAAWYWSPWITNTVNVYLRDYSYGMMAMLASMLLGGTIDYSVTMATSVKNLVAAQGVDYTVGKTQSPFGGWQERDNGTQIPAIYAFQGYMGGLMAEALILYDRIIGDSRIVPMLKIYADYMWSTQWVPLGGGPAQEPGHTNGAGYPTDQSAPGIGCFQQANVTSGTVNINSDANYVNQAGQILQPFGYLYSKGQGTQYKTQGDAIVAALAQPSAVWFLTKQFNLGFRSSPRYLGWTAGTTGGTTAQLPAPSNLVIH